VRTTTNRVMERSAPPTSIAAQALFVSTLTEVCVAVNYIKSISFP
jgi:hypothetical protein